MADWQRLPEQESEIPVKYQPFDDISWSNMESAGSQYISIGIAEAALRSMTT